MRQSSSWTKSTETLCKCHYLLVSVNAYNVLAKVMGGGVMLSKVACCVSSACILVMLAASNGTAHHSFAPHFDSSKKVHISGTVKAYEARNPHSYLHINALDENGSTQEYVCESHGVTQLSRIGITPQLFKAGTKVRITGSASRHSPYLCFFEIIELADGRS
jgi:hypothetical protein